MVFIGSSTPAGWNLVPYSFAWAAIGATVVLMILSSMVVAAVVVGSGLLTMRRLAAAD